MSALGNQNSVKLSPIEIARSFQTKTEQLYLQNMTLQQEVQRLRAMQPIPCIIPPRRNPLARILTRLIPRLGRRFDVKAVQTSGFFDAQWYVSQYPDVQKLGLDPATHFVIHGANEHRDPGPHFSTPHYLAMYPDIAENGLNPLVHYLTAGMKEGRSIRPDMPHRTTNGLA